MPAKIFGPIIDPSSTGKPIAAWVYNTGSSSWPARPAGGSAVVCLVIGPDNVSLPGDSLDGDVLALWSAA